MRSEHSTTAGVAGHPASAAWRTFFFASAAVGLVLPALSGAAVAKLGPSRFGVGGGVNNAVRQMGGAAGAALAVALVGRSGASLAQFKWLYAVLAGLGLLTALLCLPVQTRPAARTAAPAGAAS